MDEESVEKIAYKMQSAYRKNNNRENAVIDVLSSYPLADKEELYAMWQAIDAYVDMGDAK